MLYIDQLGQKIELNNTPKRVVSVVPSITELLFDLGLTSEVIGITKFCIHPKLWFDNKTRIGGTKSLNIEKIKSLNPDLIIANKEENEKDQIERIKQFCPVWTSDISTINDCVDMIEKISSIVQKHKSGKRICNSITSNFNLINTNKLKGKSLLYMIWQKPFMAVGNDSIISDIISKMGLTNCLSHLKRYPTLTTQEIKSLNPDLLFLSSEPYPFSDKHIKAFKSILPNSKIILVNGEYFSWYGSRLQNTPKYLNSLIKTINFQTKK